MSIFPLDSLRNAGIDQNIELTLEEVRKEIEAFPFTRDSSAFTREEILEVFDVSRPRLNVLAQLLDHLDGRAGVDISAGFGFLSVLLSSKGLNVTATELDLSLPEFAAAHGIALQRYEIGVDAPPFQPNSLDFVLLSEVIEHLWAAPLTVFREVSELLKPGGMLVVTTPNVARHANLEALLSGENFLEAFPEDLALGEDPTVHLEHVREYSVREVVEALEAAGLEVERALMTGWGEHEYQARANPYVNDIMVIAATK